MKRFKRGLLSLAVAAALGAGAAHAQISDNMIKIGVLSDMSSLYTDLAGAGSVVAARMAVEDSGIEKRGYKVEMVSADHQNKPDIGSAIARQWYDTDKVDVIVDVPNSGVALAVNQITKDKGKAFLVNGAASSDLTGKACSPNTVHWAYDTWMLANGTGSAIVKTGGDSWFFLTADYAFGHSLEKDTTDVVKAEGGKVIGSVRHNEFRFWGSAKPIVTNSGAPVGGRSRMARERFAASWPSAIRTDAEANPDRRVSTVNTPEAKASPLARIGWAVNPGSVWSGRSVKVSRRAIGPVRRVRSASGTLLAVVPGTGHAPPRA